MPETGAGFPFTPGFVNLSQLPGLLESVLSTRPAPLRLSSSGRCCVKVCKEAPTPTLSSARASRLSASRAFCSSGRMAPTTPHARTLLWGRHQPHPDCSLKGMRALLTSPDSAAARDLPPPPSPRLSSLHVHNTPTTHSLFSAPLAATSWPFSFPFLKIGEMRWFREGGC